MGYSQAIRYLESFVNYETKSRYPYKQSFKLERIKSFLEILGNPQDFLRCIHIAGTKGKGSVSAFIAYILREAGFSAGLYTSPHLADFRERIRILKSQRVRESESQSSKEFEGMISKKEFVSLVKRLKPLIDKFNKSFQYGPLTFFEVYTALAFIYFKEKKVDFAVLETGLGGRLDATNVVEPLVCAITPISLEHTQLLGNTLAKIALEKAGIIKGCKLQAASCKPIIISAPQEKAAREVIRNRCREMGARLYEVGRNIKCQVSPPQAGQAGVPACGGTGKCQEFNIKGIFGEYKNLKIRLLGEHQLVNAATAVGAVEALKLQGIKINIEDIRKGLYNTLWPGRCEVISKKPLIILDGAQNVASANALKKTIRENFPHKRIILVLGISSDKDIKGICKEFFPIADKIILTKSNNPRAAEAEDIKCQVSGIPATGGTGKYQDRIYLTKNVKEAIDKAKEIAKKEGLILVTGSLFVVGEARKAIVK